MLKSIHETWQDGFSGQRSLLPSLIDPVDKCGGRREHTLASCPLTMHTTHVYKHINKMLKKKKDISVGRFQLPRFWSNPCLLGMFKSFG
jgi:hypothetical protein